MFTDENQDFLDNFSMQLNALIHHNISKKSLMSLNIQIGAYKLPLASLVCISFRKKEIILELLDEKNKQLIIDKLCAQIKDGGLLEGFEIQSNSNNICLILRKIKPINALNAIINSRILLNRFLKIEIKKNHIIDKNVINEIKLIHNKFEKSIKNNVPGLYKYAQTRKIQL